MRLEALRASESNFVHLFFARGCYDDGMPTPETLILPFCTNSSRGCGARNSDCLARLRSG